MLSPTDGIEHLLEKSLLGQVALNPRKAVLTEKVAIRVVAMAQALGLSSDAKRILELAALLHRVGEAHLPDSLKDKPFIEMTSDEMTAYSRYPMFSALHVNEQHPEIMDIVLHHREYLSGAGFPDRCSADDVSIGARILCVATEYEELMLYYANSAENEVVIQRRMMKNASGRYDDEVISALMASIIEEAVTH